VVSIDEGKIIFDRGEIVRNGAALHLDQGIAVTSHASQAKTLDQVIASVPVRAFSQANEAQFYVSTSRAPRASCGTNFLRPNANFNQSTDKQQGLAQYSVKVP
jgi:hypothetical protein